MPECEAIQWKGRAASRLTNGVIELIAMTGGGHLAGLRLLDQGGRGSQNVLWEAPWETSDPGRPRTEELSRLYGPPGVGKFLASYTGHSLCLDSFGGPSAEEAAAGLSLHGEAPAEMWSVIPSTAVDAASCRWHVSLPAAQLTFEREIRLGVGESVAYVEEIVRNKGDAERAFDWVQHATFGPPFLEEGESTLAVSAKRGITWPIDYEGVSLLKKNCEFFWPNAPCAKGEGIVDLTQPFFSTGGGYLAGLQLDPCREMEYLWAANWRLRLGVGYCFRREDSPWLAVWEENQARPDPPWNNRVKARGMEFGTTALPLGRQENLRRGPIFDTPNGCILPAGAKKTARYLIFLTPIPSEIRSVEDIRLDGDAILVHGQGGVAVLSIPAQGCEEFLNCGNAAKLPDC